jgi:hypothetical protein
MSRILLIAVGMMVLGAAGVASAGEGEARRATLHGRELVWQAPPAERPYALTGQREAAQTEERTSLRPAGRSGFVRVTR